MFKLNVFKNRISAIAACVKLILNVFKSRFDLWYSWGGWGVGFENPTVGQRTGAARKNVPRVGARRYQIQALTLATLGLPGHGGCASFRQPLLDDPDLLFDCGAVSRFGLQFQISFQIDFRFFKLTQFNVDDTTLE